MDNKLILTDNRIRNLKPENAKKRLIVFDERQPGLALQITPAGTKSFQFRRWDKNRQETKIITLGKYPDLPLNQAREKAAELLTQINQGVDIEDQARQRRQEMTFADLFNQYMERHAKPRKRTWVEDENQFDRYLGGIANKKLSAITRKTIADLHGRIGETAPIAANRLLALLSSVFGRAVEFGLWEGANPCIGIRKFPEETRDRFLSADELRRFFEALESEPNTTTRDFVLVALLTGARRSNVLEMKWADLDLEAATWRIGRTKNGTPQTVALVEPVVELLRERRRQASSVFVFPGRGRTGHLVEPKKGWSRICKAAGIEGARIHDLRRTMGSWQAMTGASLPVIGKSLNHKSQSATAIYARLDLDPVRSSMQKAAEAMLATREQAPKVVKLRRKTGNE